MFRLEIDTLVRNSFKMLMEFWLGPVTERRVLVSLAPKARQRVALRPIAENRPEQARLGRDSQEQLLALRLDQPALAFAAPVRRRSIPWRARLGCERRLCSYRSSRKWSEPLPPPRVKFSNFPCVFLPGSLRNHFHAARAQSRRARSHRKARKEARSQTTWIMAPVSGQPGEEIRCRPFQFVNSKDSIKRGSRTGKSEVLGTSRR